MTLRFAADRYRGGRRQSRHSHDELHLSVVLSGSVCETVGRVTRIAGAMTVLSKDAGVVHADDYGPDGAEIARLSLADGTIGGLIDDPRRHGGWSCSDDASVVRPYLRLLRRIGAGPSSVSTDDPDVVDLLARLTAGPRRPPAGAPPKWLRDVKEWIDEEWSPGLTVTSIATRARVHPVYLARVIRHWYGIGVAEQLRRCRLQRAAAAIAHGSGSLIAVAHAAGFVDESHLSRAFRKAFGLAPGQYRQLRRHLRDDWRAMSPAKQVARIQERACASRHASQNVSLEN